MKNLKNKNNLNIFIILFLICNQLFLRAYSNEYFLSQDNGSEKSNLMDEAIELNPLIDELINNKNNTLKNIENNDNDIDNKNNTLKNIENNDNDIDNKNLNKSIVNKNDKVNNLKDLIKDKIIKKVTSNNSQNTNTKNNESKIKFPKKTLTIPKSGKISTGQFEIPARGYVSLKDEKISLNLIDADPIVALKLIAELGNYGIVIIENNKNEDILPINSNKNLVTVNFNKVDISDVFNSILLASNLQAKIEKNIIFIGVDILNKSLNSKISKTYRINQANAASVADYLSTLGARISKVYVKSSTIDGSETSSDRLQQADLKNSFISSYESEGGPLKGLIGTVDLRLQTITLIGSESLIKTSERYIKAMDRRHRQVALSIKIIDVTLTKSDIKNNLLELRAGDTRLISNSGLSLTTGNLALGSPDASTNTVGGFLTDYSLGSGKWVSWLTAKIKNDNAKVMASPTLILGENNDPNISGAASVDDDLGQATIGRPYSNEGFIKVGETVITKFEKSTDDKGITTCTGTEGTSGITFGAKVDKIDDNGYVTFALSPAISSVTTAIEIAGCGVQSTLSVRKLDTGSIRVKNKDTLILTGVIKDEESVATSKIPLLGDLPILGSLFRSNQDVSKKSELIILVTPNILNDDLSEGYNL